MRDKLSVSCKHTQTVCESQALIRINTAPQKIKADTIFTLNNSIFGRKKKGRQGNDKRFKSILKCADIAACTKASL